MTFVAAWTFQCLNVIFYWYYLFDPDDLVNKEDYFIVIMDHGYFSLIALFELLTNHAEFSIKNYIFTVFISAVYLLLNYLIYHFNDNDLVYHILDW